MTEVRVAATPVRRRRGGSEGLFLAEVDGRPFVLCEMGEEAYAVDGYCPHNNARLWKQGSLESDQRVLLCGAHGNRYDLHTGACVTNLTADDPGSLAVFPARREGEDFVIEFPD